MGNGWIWTIISKQKQCCGALLLPEITSTLTPPITAPLPNSLEMPLVIFCRRPARETGKAGCGVGAWVAGCARSTTATLGIAQ